MIVCHCRAVTDRAIRRAVRKGARTRSDVGQACAASLKCGGCAPAVEDIIAAEVERLDDGGFQRFPELAALS